jgi:hypothetical protein
MQRAGLLGACQRQAPTPKSKAHRAGTHESESGPGRSAAKHPDERERGINGSTGKVSRSGRGAAHQRNPSQRGPALCRESPRGWVVRRSTCGTMSQAASETDSSERACLVPESVQARLGSNICAGWTQPHRGNPIGVSETFYGRLRRGGE